jgi:hypothetical protein
VTQVSRPPRICVGARSCRQALASVCGAVLGEEFAAGSGAVGGRGNQHARNSHGANGFDSSARCVAAAPVGRAARSVLSSNATAGGHRLGGGHRREAHSQPAIQVCRVKPRQHRPECLRARTIKPSKKCSRAPSTLVPASALRPRVYGSWFVSALAWSMGAFRRNPGALVLRDEANDVLA